MLFIFNMLFTPIYVQVWTDYVMISFKQVPSNTKSDFNFKFVTVRKHPSIIRAKPNIRYNASYINTGKSLFITVYRVTMEINIISAQVMVTPVTLFNQKAVKYT